VSWTLGELPLIKNEKFVHVLFLNGSCRFSAVCRTPPWRCHIAAENENAYTCVMNDREKSEKPMRRVQFQNRTKLQSEKNRTRSACLKMYARPRNRQNPIWRDAVRTDGSFRAFNKSRKTPVIRLYILITTVRRHRPDYRVVLLRARGFLIHTPTHTLCYGKKIRRVLPTYETSL